MAAIKSYTDIPQSKVLAKILSLESADMYYNYNIPYAIPHNYRIGVAKPCWSLAALLNAMPRIRKFYPTIEKINGGFTCRYKGSNILWTNGINPVDACYEMVLKLHSLNLI